MPLVVLLEKLRDEEPMASTRLWMMLDLPEPGGPATMIPEEEGELDSNIREERVLGIGQLASIYRLLDTSQV